jgi:thiol-disulfide isomerase/thioredoxin
MSNRIVPNRTIAAFLLLIGLVAIGGYGGFGVVAAQDKVSAFLPAMQAGNQAIARGQYQAALDAFRKANAIQNKTSAPALLGQSLAFQGLGAFKNAVDSCDEALKYVGDDKVLTARVHNQRGMSLAAWADKPDDQKLKDAEAEFRMVLETSDAQPLAGYNLGVVLLRQNRDAEGVHELQAYVEVGGRAPEVEKARLMIENPRRARGNYSPDFSVTTLQGEYLEMKALVGRVVLLEFWGTWCGPCRAATPYVVSFAKKHVKDDWPQFLDTGAKMERAFDVHVFPSYIVIDAEGIIVGTQKGWGPQTIHEIESMVSGALKAAAKTAKGGLLVPPGQTPQ